jgi:hypothetical protein
VRRPRAEALVGHLADSPILRQPTLVVPRYPSAEGRLFWIV